MSEPLDFTGMFNTPLTPDEETRFQAWAAANNRQHDTFDYDLRGAWKADAQQASNGHLPDTWKKPNHPTFSDQSQYNNTEGMVGGRWVQNGDKWQYYASPTNIQQYGADGIQNYFKTREPDSQLIMPGRTP